MSDYEKDTLDEIFEAIDQDRDGQLSKADIRYGFQEFCGRDPVNDVRKMFWRVGQQEQDTDFIQYTEFVIGAADKSHMLSAESLQNAFSLLDTDKNGFIDASELLEVLPNCEDLVEKIIAKVDFDKDGMISFGEFLSMVFKSAKVEATSKETEWLKIVKTPEDRKGLVPERIEKVNREWKYKTDPHAVAYNPEELSPVKMPKQIVSELMAAIPRTKDLGFGEEGVPGLVVEEEADDSSEVSDHPVELPPDVLQQLKRAQADLPNMLRRVTPKDHMKICKEVKLPFMNELRNVQEHLGEYLKEVPEELRQRPEIPERPYIRELRDAQDTVLERWRNESYKYWI